MSNITIDAIIGEPEVLEDEVTAADIALAHGVESDPAWLRLKESATKLQALQVKDGSVPASTGSGTPSTGSGTAAMGSGTGVRVIAHCRAQYGQCESAGRVMRPRFRSCARPCGPTARRRRR